MPEFILNKSIALQQYKKLEPLADMISYSSKTNPDVTKILEKQTNSMFSIHSINELKHIKDCARVIFLLQATNKEQLQYLTDKAISWFVVDNESDLNIVTDFLKTYNKTINLLLRLKLKENTIKTEKHYIFGMPSETIEKQINILKNNDKIDSLGIHFHRKTQNMSEWNIKYEITNTFEENIFKHINIINIGGGLPSEYANTNTDVFKGIFNKIKEFKEHINNQGINLMIEPGRFIAAPSTVLKTKIIGIDNNTIIVDASVYAGDLDALIVPVKLLVENELQKDQGTPYIIKGVTPCSLDIFRYRVYLKDPKIGDNLTFLNAGAYNFASEFCDLKKPETIIK